LEGFFGYRGLSDAWKFVQNGHEISFLIEVTLFLIGFWILFVDTNNEEPFLQYSSINQPSTATMRILYTLVVVPFSHVSAFTLQYVYLIVYHFANSSACSHPGIPFSQGTLAVDASSLLLEGRRRRWRVLRRKRRRLHGKGVQVSPVGEYLYIWVHLCWRLSICNSAAPYVHCSSYEQLEEIVALAAQPMPERPDGIVCVCRFTSAASDDCRATEAEYERLARKNPATIFLRCFAEYQDAALLHGKAQVITWPTFDLFYRGSRVARVEGPSYTEVEDLLKRYQFQNTNLDLFSEAGVEAWGDRKVKDPTKTPRTT
jgi:hypothetical protein